MVFVPAIGCGGSSFSSTVRFSALLGREVRRKPRDAGFERRSITRGRNGLRHQLRRAAGGIEIRQQTVGAGLRQHRLQAEDSAIELRMHMREVLQVLADDEQVKQLLVHDFEMVHRRAGRRIGDAKFERDGMRAGDLRRITRRSTGYSTGSGRFATSVMPQRGHLPGVLDRTSRSMGQVNSMACCAHSNAATNRHTEHSGA